MIAASAFAIFLVLFCAGWGSPRLSQKMKWIACALALALIALAQETEVRRIDRLDGKQRALAVHEKTRRDERSKEEETRKEAVFAGMSVQAHLDTAKGLLLPSAGDNEKDLARRHLAAAGPTGKMRADAIQSRYIQLERQAAQQRAVAAAQEEKKKEVENELVRVAMAKIIENKMLDKGFDVDVTTGGQRHTTMKLRYIFVSKVLVHQLSQQDDIIDSLRKAGFKKLTATDGFEQQWTMRL